MQILEAITTEKCSENFSLERLEILGDAFLKFAVGRYLFLKHDALDEGQLTRKRSKLTNNLNLFKLAKLKNLQVIAVYLFSFSLFYKLLNILMYSDTTLSTNVTSHLNSLCFQFHIETSSYFQLETPQTIV